MIFVSLNILFREKVTRFQRDFSARKEDRTLSKIFLSSNYRWNTNLTFHVFGICRVSVASTGQISMEAMIHRSRIKTYDRWSLVTIRSIVSDEVRLDKTLFVVLNRHWYGQKLHRVTKYLSVLGPSTKLRCNYRATFSAVFSQTRQTHTERENYGKWGRIKITARWNEAEDSEERASSGIGSKW